MKKLYIILLNDNVLRSSLEELTVRTSAIYWLVVSPHALERSTPHCAIFSRILEHEHFTTAALIELLEPELARLQPSVLRFLTHDESCEVACAELQQYFAEPVWSAEQVLPFVNKIVSKKALAKADIRLPRHLQFDKQRYLIERNAYCESIAATIGFPMIVKPVNLYASIEVRRLETLDDLCSWAAWSTGPRDRLTYEIDEYIDGELFHCDSLIQNGALIWSNACKNVNPCMQFAAGRSIGAFNMPADQEEAVAVREFNARVLAALNPPDGSTHMECFMLPSKELVFLEIAARPPGGETITVYKYCFGFDLGVAHFMLRAKEPYRLELNQATRYGGWIIHPKQHGQVKAIHMPQLHSESEVWLNVAVGQMIDADSRHIGEEPAAEFCLYSPDYRRVDEDGRTLKELHLCEMDG